MVWTEHVCEVSSHTAWLGRAHVGAVAAGRFEPLPRTARVTWALRQLTGGLAGYAERMPGHDLLLWPVARPYPVFRSLILRLLCSQFAWLVAGVVGFILPPVLLRWDRLSLPHLIFCSSLSTGFSRWKFGVVWVEFKIFSAAFFLLSSGQPSFTPPVEEHLFSRDDFPQRQKDGYFSLCSASFNYLTSPVGEVPATLQAGCQVPKQLLLVEVQSYLLSWESWVRVHYWGCSSFLHSLINFIFVKGKISLAAPAIFWGKQKAERNEETALTWRSAVHFAWADLFLL